MLPLFPAASLLVGILWHELLKAPTPELRKGFLYSFFVLSGILIVAIFCVWFIPPADLKAEYGLDFVSLKYCSLGMAGAFLVPFFLYLKKHLKASFFATAGAMVAVFLFILLVIVPWVDPYRSTKEIAQRLDRMLPPGEKIVFYRVLRDSALFYTNRKALVLRNPQQLKDYLASNQRVYCIIRRGAFESIENLEKIVYIIGQEGNRLIISNQKSPSS